METENIDQRKVLSALKTWATASEIEKKLGASKSARRKILSILRVLSGLGKVKIRPRPKTGRGRPPFEFRKSS